MPLHHKPVEPEKGVEPSLTRWKRVALPLRHSSIGAVFTWPASRPGLRARWRRTSRVLGAKRGSRTRFPSLAKTCVTANTCNAWSLVQESNLRCHYTKVVPYR